MASRHGLEVVAKALVDAGANVNARDWESGWTPLTRALYFGHIRVALLLLQAGALLEGGDSDRKNRSRSHSESLSFSGKSGSVRSTIANGRSDRLGDHDGNCPLDVLSLELRPALIEARATGRGGDVYSFGKADFCLGYDSFGKTDVVKPRRIEALANLQVVRVSASRCVICQLQLQTDNMPLVAVATFTGGIDKGYHLPEQAGLLDEWYVRMRVRDTRHVNYWALRAFMDVECYSRLGFKILSVYFSASCRPFCPDITLQR